MVRTGVATSPVATSGGMPGPHWQPIGLGGHRCFERTAGRDACGLGPAIRTSRRQPRPVGARRGAAGRRAARPARALPRAGARRRAGRAWPPRLLVAILVYGMPAPDGGGVGRPTAPPFGLLPIGWIVLNAIFVYDITVKTGKFEVVKDTIAGLAGDRRIQVLLIAFSFGAFIEGAAGLRHAGRDLGGDADRPRLPAARRRPGSRSSATPRRSPTARSARRSSRSPRSPA